MPRTLPQRRLAPILNNINKQISGESKRPDHLHFMRSDELAREKFSGVRQNNITEEVEVWVVGEIALRVTKADLLRNPDLASIINEYFGLIPGKKV